MNALKKLFCSKGMLAAAFWYTMGTILIQSAEYATLPVFTKLLPPNDFGMVSIYTMWVSVIMLFVGLQGFGSIANARLEFGEKNLNGYLSSISAMGFFSFLFFLTLTFIFKQSLAQLLDIRQELIVLMVVQSYAMFCIQMLTSKFTATQQRYGVLAVSAVVCLSTVGLSLFLVYRAPVEERYLARILGIAVPYIVLGVGVLLFLLLRGRKLFCREYWKFCLPLTAPLIFHCLSHIVLNQSDRYMLSKIMDYKATGIYSFACTIGFLGKLVFTSFNNAWVPWYFDTFRNGKKSDIVHTFQLYRAIILMVNAALLFLTPEIVRMMGSSAYQDAVYIVPLIQLGAFFNFLYLFPVTQEFYYKKTIWIAIGTICCAIVNILLNLFFIPWLGGAGAAITTAISCFMLFVMHDLIVRKKLKDFPINHRDLYGCGVLMMAMTGSFYLVMNLVVVRMLMIAAAAMGFAFYLVYKTKERPETL